MKKKEGTPDLRERKDVMQVLRNRGGGKFHKEMSIVEYKENINFSLPYSPF